VFLQLHLQRTSVSEGESWEHPTKPPFLPQDLIDVHLFLTSFQRQREGTGRKSRRLHLHQGDGEVAGFRDGRVVGSRRRRRRRRMLRGHEPGHGPWRSPWRMRQDSGEGRQLGRRLRWTVQSVGLYALAIRWAEQRFVGQYLGSRDKVGIYKAGRKIRNSLARSARGGLGSARLGSL
jgi:hypothetical protein